MQTQSRQPADEPILVQEGSGWWKGEGLYRIPQQTAALDPAKLAKARADTDAVARMMGWV